MELDTINKRGRDKNLIRLRDEKLIKRYYYWTEFKRRRFDDVLNILSKEEFFISEQRVDLIIRKNNDYLNKLIKKKPKLKDLELMMIQHQ